ncbi:hypothetical protein GC194_02590 [bacterium]|nr:hypothetical protein [bacterium]
MQVRGIDWISSLLLLLPLTLWTMMFIKATERVTKVECVMAEIVCLLGFLSYSIPKTGGLGNELESAAVSIAFGVIAGFALLVIGLIEIKKFDK